MKLTYIAIIAIVAGVHIYIGFKNNISPLNFNLILLLLLPFLIFVWKDAASIKFGTKGLELEKLKKDVNKTIKHAVHGKNIDQSSIELLFKSVQANDWLKLVLARMLMRKGLVILQPNHGLGSAPSLEELILVCFETGQLDEMEKNDLEKLRDITYYAEWWDGDVPTYESWNWGIAHSPLIIQKLFDKQPII